MIQSYCLPTDHVTITLYSAALSYSLLELYLTCSLCSLPHPLSLLPLLSLSSPFPLSLSLSLSLSLQVEAPAKAGALAPIDVHISPINTGLGPEKTSFFQALQIATKISRGTIEILVSNIHPVLDQCVFTELRLDRKLFALYKHIVMHCVFSLR